MLVGAKRRYVLLHTQHYHYIIVKCFFATANGKGFLVFAFAFLLLNHRKTKSPFLRQEDCDH